MKDLHYKSATWMAQAIRQGELSSRELVQASIERIRQVNPRLNAVVQLTAGQAMDDAQKADEEWKQGSLRGPLHGVPMTIKDSIDTAGVVTTWGTVGRKGHIPGRDATIVSRLKRAGAILLGKTNTPEMTLSFATANRVYGRTNNPHDLSRTPGGSSGGAAAIVASGGSPFDVGSDTGGSIRLPAHLCGVSGIRPTSGRVPRTGHAIPPGGPLDALTQLGPLARFVEDLALIVPIIAGPDGKDSWVSPVTLANMGEVLLEGRRAAFFTDNGICSPSAEVKEAVVAAAKVLSDGGLNIEEHRPPGVQESFEIFDDLLTGWILPWARRRLTQEGTSAAETATEGLGEARVPSMDELLDRFDRWERFRMRMADTMACFDLILSPVMAYPAFPHGAYTDESECFSYTLPFSLTGWPVAVVPAVWTEEGLPIGVQISAQPWREEVALTAAARVEEVLGGWRPPLL